MTFRELLEGLKILKKTNKTIDSNNLGNIGKFKVINSKHATEPRRGIKRNEGLDITSIKNVIREFIKKVPKPKNSKYDIIYKNPKYNKLVIKVKNNEIFIITIIQSQRSTNTYKIQDNQVQVSLDKVFEEFNLIKEIYEYID